MSIIEQALENLQSQYPKLSIKKVKRKIRRIIQKKDKHRSRKDRQYILDFTIILFDMFFPHDVVHSIAKSVEPKIRKRLLQIPVLLLCLLVSNLSSEIDSYSSLLQEVTARLKKHLPDDVHAILSKSSFSYQFATRSPVIFKHLLLHLLNHIMEKSLCGSSLINDRYTVKAVDCSIFNLPKSLKKIFLDNSGKVQCRFHLVFDVVKKVVETFTLTDARANEMPQFKALFNACRNVSSTIWVCDLGYWAYWLMDYIIDHKSQFVFRLKSNAQYTMVKILDAQNAEYLVRLGSGQKKHMNNVVRLVMCPQEGSDIYWYATSILDPRELSAHAIRCIYRQRWMIEIFFRDLKYVLDFKPMSRSQNGIEIEFYGALITHTFVKIIMHDVSTCNDIAIDDLSFEKSYRAINSWFRDNYELLSSAQADREIIIQTYHDLLDSIAHTCINESTKKRLAKQRKRKRQIAA